MWSISFLRRLAAFALLVSLASSSARAGLPLDRIKLAPGFSITVLTDRVPGARSLALGDDGVVFVGSMRAGRVYAVKTRDGKAESVTTVASGLDFPNGVAYRSGALYVAEINRITRYDAIISRLAKPPSPLLVNEQLPHEYHHGWKFIAFGPDGKLYVPVGAPCNVCAPDPKRFANIMRMNADGSGLEAYALGVRNSVGFDWHPVSRELWFSDNGRDWLGDDLPSCELNRAPEASLHFGFPYCHQGDLLDPEFGAGRRCEDYVPPALKVGAHVAPLGLRFYTGDMFPSEYRHNIFLALHGSWNRSAKSGYKLMRVVLSGNQVARYEPFAEGWLNGESNWGRPVDVLVMPDGALLVSDDQNGVLYRIAYSASGR
jgi:glucose/arabinose dehydrogenase